MRLAAPAKLNLGLRVVGRRADGYHLLDSELVLLELADDLLLMPGCSGLRVEAPPGEEVPLDRGNLAWRGMTAGLGGQPELACLTLRKRIPVAAGMGGGSSDAAAGWRLARRSIGAPEMVAAGDLAALAEIGADVPFFAAQCASARIGGIGEVIVHLPAPAPGAVLLVHPPFRLATRAVFAELRPEEWGSAGPEGNDLLAAALRLRPELAAVMGAAAAAGGEPRLTGSGPTLFVREVDPERAAALAGTLREAGLRVTETRIRREPASIEPLSDDPEGA